MNEDRLKKIIQMAQKLDWIYPPNKTSYPLMQLSEVEKCMLAMFDDFQLNRMRKWVEEKDIQYQRSQDAIGKEAKNSQDSTGSADK